MATPQTKIWTLGNVEQNRPATFFAHLQYLDNGNNVQDLTQGVLSTIACKVTSGGKVTYSNSSLSIGSTVFNTLQTSTGWKVDTTGFNFAFQMPASALPYGNASALVQFDFTLSSGNEFSVQMKVEVLPTS